MKAFFSRSKTVFASLAFTCALGFGTLSPAPASAAGLADLFIGLQINEGCTQFMGPYGAPVSVRYFQPKSGCAGPAVIIFHGSDGDTRYSNDYTEVGRGLAVEGYSAFIVHYFEGAPGLRRPGPVDKTLPDPNAFFAWKQVCEQSVSFVQTFPGVNPARVGILGMSLGGYLGASVSVNDPRVRGVAILSGGLPDIYADKVGMMPPTLIAHGDHDADVPVTEAYKLHDVLAQRGLWNDLMILPCEGHLPYHTYKDAVAAKVLAFFNSAL